MRFLPVTLNSLLVELADLDETLALLASLEAAEKRIAELERKEQHS